MKKIAWVGGHGKNTPGKRSPNDEREWEFNNKVVEAGMAYLARFENVQQVRVDDPSGNVDVSLETRTNKANQLNVDLYLSCHHNALSGKWGNHGGVETFVHPDASKESKEIAALIHPKVVNSMGLQDRGLRTANFHELRETNMPAVLVEGGFMDSRIDIKQMRDDRRLKSQGEAIAKGVAEYFNLKLKVSDTPPEVKGVSKVEEYKKDAQPSKSLAADFIKAVDAGITDGTYPQRPASREEVAVMVYRATKTK